jgi:uncharacterized protein YndB with AHSA1/START domain
MARELHITRVYDATPQQLWDAWTQPQQLARWWGKRGWTAQPGSIVLDVRPGGTFKVTTVNDTTGDEMTNDGTYTRVQEPHELAFGETVVTFEALPNGRTRMTFRTTTDAQQALFDRMQTGVNSAFDRLEETLAP